MDPNDSFCIQESFNVNNFYQIFVYKLTFVNSQPENTNSKGDCIFRNWFETIVLRISCLQK